MPSRTIRPTEAPASAPFAYTIGTTDGLAAESVFAQWDGSGAGGDFLPCVSYYNAEGVLLDRAFPDGVTLHAGDTAEVSYRPFKRGGGGGGASLTVEDFITSVTDTNEIRFLPPMEVSQTGPGRALISLNLDVVFALGTFAGATNPPTLDLPITTTTSSGITTTAGRWVIPDFGIYLLTLSATVRFLQNNPAFATGAVVFFNFTHVDVYGAGLSMTPIAVPPAQEVDFAGSWARLVRLQAGDHLGVQLTAGGGALGVGTFGGTVGIDRVA